MRLFFLHPFLSSKGGAQLALLWLLRGFRARGDAVKLFTAADPEGLSKELLAEGISVSIFSLAGVGTGSLNEKKLFPLAERLEEEIEAWRPELVVAGNFPATVWGGFTKGRMKKFPGLLWVANEPPRHLYEEEMSKHFLRSKVDPRFYFPWTLWLKRRKQRKEINLEQACVQRFDILFAISKQTAHWIKAIYHKEAQMVPLGIRDMQTMSQEVYPDESPFLFLSPAGLEPIKNFKTVLEAFGVLKGKFSTPHQAKLLVTGDGAWRDGAEKLARRLNIREDVDFLGQISRQSLINFYKKCHAVIYIPLDEPYGLVSCEAGLSGKPVVASNHGGPAEIVLPGITGFLVAPLDSREVAKAMLSLLQNRALCKKMGEAALERVSTKFSFEQCFEKLRGGFLREAKK